MATRPVFIASLSSLNVDIRNIEFQWHPGYAISQKQKSICSLHRNAGLQGINNILEVSSKSPFALGVQLSAFNLKSKTIIHDKEFTVESAFQGGKIFSHGGPYTDLIFSESIVAKKDPRIRNSGHLVGFIFFGYAFKLTPKTLYYDWLYINSLLKNKKLIDELCNFSAFTDIEFNPKKSLNCQAFSLALFCTLFSNGALSEGRLEPDQLESIARPIYKKFEQTVLQQAYLL